MSLSQYLIQIRQKKGLTQQALADLSGLSKGTIGKIEAGFTEAPGIDVIIALAKGLRVSPIELIKAYQGIDPYHEDAAKAYPESTESLAARVLADMDAMQKHIKQLLEKQNTPK